ncbi:MAG: hypothetical protein ACR2JB_18465 [Bryobacteraceae bacterium]
MKQSTPVPPQTSVNRITWRDGQALTSRDMQDTAQFSNRLRWLHNLYMHNAARGNWGIVDGYETALTATMDSFAVNEGFALDAYGRELILPRNVVVPVPANLSGLLVLVIRYQENKTYCQKRPLAGACERRVLGPRFEFPAFVWLDADEFDPSKDIPLIAANVSAGNVLPPLIQPGRPIARPITNQKFAHDVTTSYETIWRNAIGTNSKFWFEARVSTLAAGFIRTPLYFANVQGPAGKGTGGRENGAVFVDDVTIDGFTVRVLTGFANFGLPASAKEANQQGWVVSWRGLEPLQSPPKSSLVYLHLSGYEITGVKLFQ